MRSTLESQISQSIQSPALFPDEQPAQQEGILRRVNARTGLDLHHRDLEELSQLLENYDYDSIAQLAATVDDCRNDEHLHRLLTWEHRLSIRAILIPRPAAKDWDRR